MTDRRAPELQRAAAALDAVTDAAGVVYTAATGRAVHQPGPAPRPPADTAGLAVTADYAAALDHLDRCVHSAPPEYLAEAAHRYLAAVTDATAAPGLGAALTGLRTALTEYYAAEADVAAMVDRRRAKRAVTGR